MNYCPKCGYKLNLFSKYCPNCGNCTIILGNPYLALELFHTLSVGFEISPKNKITINSILNSCNSRQEILNNVIKLCGSPPITSMQRYIYAMTYAWSNKEYRQKAIIYLEEYLNNELWDGAYKNKIINIKDDIETSKLNHIYDMRKYLAVAYEKEYQFDKAKENYEIMIKIDPYLPFGYNGLISILIKENKINEAISYLNELKQSKYYCKNNNYVPNDWLIKSINDLLKDCKEKKKKGYIYKPRKRNRVEKI